MTKRLHDCISCHGKTRHDHPANCSQCREFERLWGFLPATKMEES